MPGMVQASARISVLVVDDSALVRSLLSEIINLEPDMRCVGVAKDPLRAREMIRELNPDVITLDVEMPRMDGIDFLERLMRLRPMPVVMISSLTEHGAAITLRALEIGAVDFVVKPRIGVANGLQELASDITEKIRIAAASRPRRSQQPTPPSTVVAPTPAPAPASAYLAPPSMSVIPGSVQDQGILPGTAARTSPLVEPEPAPRQGFQRKAGTALSAPGRGGQQRTQGPRARVHPELVIAMGASTGGTEALREVLGSLPQDCPPVVITQHMPPGFTASFAARLNSQCALQVEARRDKLGGCCVINEPAVSFN